MRGDKIFIDTNILIYAYDISAGKKHEISKNIIIDLWDKGNGILSTQVLQEFFVAVTKKISKPLNVRTAKEIVNDLLKWDVVVNDGDSILGAIDIHENYQYSFWDSMIIYSALTSGADLLFSEDLADGQVIKGMKIVNPFKNK